MKSPCLTCPNKDQDKGRFAACVDCEDRHEYADAVAGPLSKPSEFAGEKAEPVTMQCNMCKSVLPLEQFRPLKRGNGRLMTCPGCEEKYLKPTKNPAEAQKKNGTSIPPGFIKYSNAYTKGQEFISITDKAVSISAEVTKRIGVPRRVDIFFNPKTRQIGIMPNKDGAMSLSLKNGNGVASCKMLIDKHKIKPEKRLPVEYHGNFVMTKEGLK